MARNERTSKIVNALLQCVMISGGVAIAIIAPNAIQLLDKPLRRYFQNLDQRTRERELAIFVRYACRQGLLAEDYQFGLVLTKKGKQRLDRQAFDELRIDISKKWDEKWHLMIFDIPSSQNARRVQLTKKLSRLGLQLMQQSVWVHPFYCRPEIEQVCRTYGVEKYVTYIETDHIDHMELLRRRFKKILPNN